MTDLNEKSLSELLGVIREPLAFTPSRLVVSPEGLDRMKVLCADDPEFRKRVIAEFPQLDGVI